MKKNEAFLTKFWWLSEKGELIMVDPMDQLKMCYDCRKNTGKK